MKDREIAVIEALLRTQSFLTENMAALAGEDPIELARPRAKVDEVLTRLMRFSLDQDIGQRGALGETATQRQLRIDLRNEWLKPIAAIARRNLPRTPEFDALQLPRASARGPAFIASARGMASAAAEHREALVAYGLPDNFVAALNTALDRFEVSVAGGESCRSRHIHATKGLEVETREARTVLTVLDALVGRWAKENDPLRAAWKGARLIRRRPGPMSGTAAPATSNGSEAAPVTGEPLSAN